MAYATYQYYVGTYGGSMSEANFTLFSRRASAEIDRLTNGRAAESDYTTELANACCAISDTLAERGTDGAVVSASNDGYSETYSGTKSRAQRIYGAAMLYLGNTGLLLTWI